MLEKLSKTLLLLTHSVLDTAGIPDIVALLLKQDESGNHDFLLRER
jgi:hypothetical protein